MDSTPGNLGPDAASRDAVGSGPASPTQATREQATAPPTPAPATGPPWNYAPPPPPPTTQRRRMSGCTIAIIVSLGLAIVGGFVAMIIVGAGAGLSSQSGFAMGGERIAVITVSGVIQSSDGGSSFLSPALAGSREIMRQLREAGEEDEIKAVLLRINSPGGSAAASQAIFTEVLRLRDKKPVVVSMGDVAASGGYYIAAAATTIVANPATMTGSIGVITQSYNWSELAEKYGVRDETITSGKFKDVMNPFRPMREGERELMQAMVDDVYGQFVDDIARARKKPSKARLKKLADGRVFTGRQAKKIGLVDELGNFHKALDIAAKKAGIEGEPKIKDYGRGHGFYGWLSEMVRSGRGGPFSGMRAPGPALWMLMEENQIVAAK